MSDQEEEDEALAPDADEHPPESEEAAVQHALRQDGEPEEGLAVPFGGGPAQRKSRYAFVAWRTGAAPGAHSWFGQFRPTRAHSPLKTPYYRIEEQAARAVDR